MPQDCGNTFVTNNPMTTQTNHKYPWLTITVGLIGLVITIAYYNSIINDHVIYYTTVDIFAMYGWTVIIVGSILSVWAYFKLRTFSKLWLLIFVLFCNIATLIYFYSLLKPLPSQFRFSLTNKTNHDLTELHVSGDKVLSLDDLKQSATLDFIVSEYSENSEIDLICMLDNKTTDTLNLASGVTNSCGYYYDLDITLKDGRLNIE